MSLLILFCCLRGEFGFEVDLLGMDMVASGVIMKNCFNLCFPVRQFLYGHL